MRAVIKRLCLMMVPPVAMLLILGAMALAQDDPPGRGHGPSRRLAEALPPRPEALPPRPEAPPPLPGVRCGGKGQVPAAVNDYAAFRNSYDHGPPYRLAPPGGTLDQPIGRIWAARRSLSGPLGSARRLGQAADARGAGAGGAGDDGPCERGRAYAGPYDGTYYDDYEKSGREPRSHYYDEDLPMEVVRDRRQRVVMSPTRLVDVLMVSPGRRGGDRVSRLRLRGLYVGERW